MSVLFLWHNHYETGCNKAIYANFRRFSGGHIKTGIERLKKGFKTPLKGIQREAAVQDPLPPFYIEKWPFLVTGDTGGVTKWGYIF